MGFVDTFLAEREAAWQAEQAETRRHWRYVTAYWLRKHRYRLVEGRQTRWGAGQSHLAQAACDPVWGWEYFAICGSTMRRDPVSWKHVPDVPVTCKLCIAKAEL